MDLIPILFILLVPQGSLIPAGTQVDARLESAVRTGTSSIGDSVVAVLTKPVFAANVKVIPEGSRLHGRVETLQPATSSTEGRVRLVFREIELPEGRRLPTWITDSFSAREPRRGWRYAVFIGAGATAGAFLGGNTARTAGILGGTLIGFIVANNSGNSKPDLTLKRGGMLHLKFGEDLVLR
jgi:hypothetical protein